jgi:hypothetical protein
MDWRRRARVADEPLRIDGSQVAAASGAAATSGAAVSGAATASKPAEPRTDGSATAPAGQITVRGVLEKVSLFVAPPTLVIALAFWFGWTLTNARSAYFGIDSSTLGYSTTDYLLRSADATFVPVAVLLLAILAVITLHGLVRHAATTPRGANVVGLGAIGGATLGAVLILFAMWAMFEPLPASYYLVPPVILGLGPALLAYSVWILRHVRVPSGPRASRAVPAWEGSGYVVAAIIALLGIFWTSSLYATALGRGRAEVLAENLSSRPAVTVFSVKSLGIDAPGVTASKLTDASSAYKFRYSGLRLLTYSAHKYFLVNSGWSHDHGVAIVLDDTPDIRLEFTPGG